MAMRLVSTAWLSVGLQCAGVVLIATSASAPAQLFAAPAEGTITRPSGLAVLDLDGSLRLDIAALRSEDDSVTLLRAQSDGHYKIAETWNAGTNPQALVAADMDHDDFDDLLVINGSTSLLAVLLLSDGGETARTWTYAFSGQPKALAAGDLNGDGNTDVVVTETQLDRVAVRPGLGATGMGPSVTYAVGARPTSVALGDVDGDGWLDIVTGSSTTPNLTVLFADGVGSFRPPVTVPVSGLPLHLTCANFDGDADFDVAVTTKQPAAVQVLLSDGLGGFVPASTAPLPAGEAVVAAGDLDADGLPDLVVSTGVTSSAIALLNAGSGILEPAAEHGVPVAVRCLALGDLDLDGRPDLLTDNGITATILWGDGQGGFVEPSREDVPQAIQLSAIADVDVDGFSDLLLVDKATNEVSVRLGDGEGGLAPPFVASVGAHGFLRLADLDEDGVPDLMTAGLDSIQVCLGDGRGGFAPPLSTVISREPMDAGVADMDGDGHMDVVVASAVPFDIHISHGVGVMLGDGTGQLGPLQSQIEYDNFGQVVAYGVVALTELNGDGFTDVVIHDFAGAALRYFWGSGTGGLSFGGSLVVPVSFSKTMLPVDLDSDSDTDLVYGNQVFLGDGLGGFGPLTTISTSAFNITGAADLNGDGLLDLLSPFGSSGFAVLLGDGGGQYALEVYGIGTSSLRLARLNADALPDVLGMPIISSTPGKIWVSTNRTEFAAWSDMGYGLAGTNGVPVLAGSGTLEAGSPGTLKLSNANPSKLAVLFISKQSNPAPFKGGVLATVPPLISFLLFTSPSGSINLSWNNWPGGAPGSHWYFQYGIVDSGGPAGAALSNALRATQP